MAVSVNTVVAELRNDNEGLSARVYVIREGNLAGGTRQLGASTHDCTELAAALALAISVLALDRLTA